MGNELTNKSNSYIANTENYFDLIAQEAASFSTGGHMFMKFNGNDGEFSYGADNEELKLGTLLAFNPNSFKRGFLCWVGGEVVDEVMVGVNEGPKPSKTSLADHGPYEEDGDGWSEQYTGEFRMIEEPFINLLFQANNASKRRAFEGLIQDFARGYKLNPDCWPIVEIDEREFEAKGGKDSKRKYKKHAPIFKIVEWKSEADLLAMVEGAEADYEAETEEVEDERPARTSRREEERVETRRAAPRQEEERPRRTAARAEEPVYDEDEEEDTPPPTRTRRLRA